MPLLELNVQNITPPPRPPTMNGGEWGRDVDCFCYPKLPHYQIWPNVYVLPIKNGIFRTFLLATSKEISDFNILQLKHDDIF